jgi:acetylornithine deacetylase/succinyl-diaminopimelate desuccinylase-like protein
MMPELLADLERLVAIPSVAFPGYPPEPVAQMADETLRLFREAGFDAVRSPVSMGRSVRFTERGCGRRECVSIRRRARRSAAG